MRTSSLQKSGSMDCIDPDKEPLFACLSSGNDSVFFQPSSANCNVDVSSYNDAKDQEYESSISSDDGNSVLSV